MIWIKFTIVLKNGFVTTFQKRCKPSRLQEHLEAAKEYAMDTYENVEEITYKIEGEL